MYERVCVRECVCVCVWCVSHSQKNVDEGSLEMKLEGKWSLITASFISLQITQEQLNTTHTNTSHFKSAWLSIPASRINLVFPTNPNPTSPFLMSGLSSGCSASSVGSILGFHTGGGGAVNVARHAAYMCPEVNRSIEIFRSTQSLEAN